MEKRKFDRFTVQGEMEGNIVFATVIDIRDISLGGTCFLITKRLHPRTRCFINLKQQDIKLNLKGTVTRSVFKGTKKMNSDLLRSTLRYVVPGILKVKKTDIDFLPVYEVAVEFDQMTEETKASLQNIINYLKECNGSSNS